MCDLRAYVNRTLCFNSFSCIHVKRSGNAVADKLAKLAKYSHSKVWYDDIPYDVKQLVLVDKSFCRVRIKCWLVSQN